MLTLRPDDRNAYKILCLGAHSDDIEIGCGGTILRLIRDYPNVVCYWVVFSADEQRAREAHAGAAAFLRDARERTVVVKDFRDGFFPFVGGEIKEYFEGLKREFSPDIIFTHHRQDLHQDHRLLSELTWNTFRGQLILEYEIPKYDGGLGAPNLFVQLDEELCRRKVRHIADCFGSQARRQWFDDDTFLALLRLRGLEANAATRYAEAFYGRKLVL